MTCNISKNMVIVSIIILVAIVVWIMYSGVAKKENFAEETIQTKVASEEETKKNANEPVPRTPFVNPETGTLMDGPGFERPLPDEPIFERSSVIPSNYYFLDDGANGEFSVQHNMCSKSCCSEQWPTPFKQKYDPYVCNNKDKFVPSNIFCNNSFQDSGCLCLSKKQASFMYNRGGNGREWF